LSCPVGFVLNSNQVCTNCPAGKFASFSLCQDCENGKFSLAGCSSCVDCPTHTFQDKTGQSSCKNCPQRSGTASKKGSTSCTAQLCNLKAFDFSYSFNSSSEVFFTNTKSSRTFFQGQATCSERYQGGRILTFEPDLRSEYRLSVTESVWIGYYLENSTWKYFPGPYGNSSHMDCTNLDQEGHLGVCYPSGITHCAYGYPAGQSWTGSSCFENLPVYCELSSTHCLRDQEFCSPGQYFDL
jgi:hypothetical protein